MKPKVAILSLWRNDAYSFLEERAYHLLDKTYPNTKHIWIVGDTTDQTANKLKRIVRNLPHILLRYDGVIRIPNEIHMAKKGIVIYQHDTEFADGLTVADRLKRLEGSANLGLDCLSHLDDYVMIHESDIMSPPNIVELFMENAQQGRCPIASWPVLYDKDKYVFYDTWAYRANGYRFMNYPPYHPVYDENNPFIVDSVGTCWMFPAGFVLGENKIRLTDGTATIGLCNKLRERGATIWVDPTIIVEQNINLYVKRVPL